MSCTCCLHVCVCCFIKWWYCVATYEQNISSLSWCFHNRPLFHVKIGSERCFESHKFQAQYRYALLVARHMYIWFVAWYSCRTLVFDGQTFPVLWSTCSWRVTTCVDKPSAISANQANSAFYPFGVDKWGVGCNWVDVRNLRMGRRHLVKAYEVKAGIGVIAGKTVWSMPERLEWGTTKRTLYKYTSFTFIWHLMWLSRHL